MEDPGRKLQSETNLVADVKSLISVAKPKKKKFLVYSFMFAFIAFTVFFAFNPNGDSYPWINRFFTTSSENPSSYSSKLSSFFSFIFPYSHSSPFPETVSDVKNKTQSQEKKPLPTTLGMKQNGVSSNLTEKSEGKSLNGDLAKGNFTEKGKVGVLNSTSLVEGKNGFSYNLTGNGGHAILNSTSSLDNKHGSLPPNNVTEEKKGLNSSIQQHAISEKTKALNSSKSFEEKKTYSGTIALNATSSLMKKNNNINDLRKYNEEKLIASMMKCDLFHGNWVFDESYPLYPRGSCQHIDESFNCYLNGRPDRNYENLRWQPNGCSIPRLNATDMLERLRGKRLVFVGDSLNRNMWESLVCTLKNSIQDKKRVFEASGRHEFRTEGSYSFLFVDYNCSVEFFRSPFLVQEWETPETNGKTRETLRLDVIENSSHKYKDADIIVFNTGHWWTHEKTSKGQDYYQEGSHVYGQLNVVEAFRRALTTWARWVDANIDPKKTLVFFRGYSSSHFSGGQWNSGGQCDKETEPIKNKVFLSPYPPKMYALESVLKGMKTKILYLNITRMTDYRKDGHPSVYRKQHLTEEERKSPLRYQDCSHWCLPGVPDSWNELLYAQLLIKQHKQ